MKENLFLLHGIFMHGYIMQYMQRHLSKCGYQVHTFSYRSVHRSMTDNAARLIDFVQSKTDTDTVNHFVGHSLGGLLIRLAYEQDPRYYTGRIVTLGTPHNGSLVARRVAGDIYHRILGGAYEDALDGDLPPWRGDVELGSIAGNKSIGIALAIPDLEKPNDGTVAVSETYLDKQTDHVEVNTSHTALVYSKRAIKQVDAFLQQGQFIRTSSHQAG